MMKVDEFIRRLKEVEKMPTLYKWGTFMNRKKGKYLLCDCSGLVKGILWGYPWNGKYPSNGVLDLNANNLINICKNVSSDFNKIEIGEFVWLRGHCGVYVGNGQVIESSPKWENGIQVTQLNQRKWKKHGFLPYVDYTRDRPNLDKFHVNKPIEPPKQDLEYVVGKVYTLLTNVNVRVRPDSNSPMVGYSHLTADGKKHDKNKNGSLDKGTRVTCQNVTTVGNKVWIKCPSGWLCAKNNGKKYIG